MCETCHTDVLAVDGLRPDPSEPVVPGHEIVGEGVAPVWRVGAGFVGGQDKACESCRRGDFTNCSDQPRRRTDLDGGYAEVIYARSPGRAPRARLPRPLE